MVQSSETPHLQLPFSNRSLAHLLHVRGQRAQVSLCKLICWQKEVVARKPEASHSEPVFVSCVQIKA